MGRLFLIRCLLRSGFDNVKDVENIEVFFTISLSLDGDHFIREQTLRYPH
jgi:hypothetical protein